VKTHHCVIALALASALAFSSLAHADTLPAGAERFNLYTGPGGLSPIDIPEGRTLVITDLAILQSACTLRDGDEEKILVTSQVPLHLQTGVEFSTRVSGSGFCIYVFLTGYWLDATANR